VDNNYFILRASVKNQLQIYFYNIKSCNYWNLNYPICFNMSLNKYHQAIYLLSVCKLVHECSTSHKFYLGKEIFKAQLAIKLKHVYIQD